MIDSEKFNSFCDLDLRLVKEHEFRKSVFKDGIDEYFRPEIWKFLFHFYSFNSTPRERLLKEKELAVEYYIMKAKWKQMVEKIENQNNSNYEKIKIDNFQLNMSINLEENVYRTNLSKFNKEDNLKDKDEINCIKIQKLLQLSFKNVSNVKYLMDDINQIDKDIERTGYLKELDGDDFQLTNELEKKRISEALRNILVTFSAFNQNLSEAKNQDQQCNLGYTQGMNELASVFISVFNDESVAYWCFSNFMLIDSYTNSAISLNTTKIEDTHILKTNVAFYFSDLGMSKKLKHLSDLLNKTDSQLFNHLEKLNSSNLYFAHEWLILYFKRCFRTTVSYHKCFEMINSHFLELHTSALKNISVKDLYSFDLFICLSLLEQMRIALLQCDSETDLYEVLKEKKNLNLFSDNYNQTIKLAEEIFEKYCIKTQSSNEMSQIKTSNSTNSVSLKFAKFKELFN